MVLTNQNERFLVSHGDKLQSAFTASMPTNCNKIEYTFCVSLKQLGSYEIIKID